MTLFFLSLILLVSSSHAGYYPKSYDGGLGGPCEFDVDCSFIDNTYCKMQRTCECKPGFSSSPDFQHCVAVSGTPCHYNTDCSTLPGSYCNMSSGSCACKEGMVPSLDKFKCLRTSGYNSECAEDIQCKGSLGDASTCKENGLCSCLPRYHLDVITNRCFFTKGLGDHCFNSSDCYAAENDRSQNYLDCVNTICNCRPGLTRKDNRCVNGSTALLSTFVLVVIALIIATCDKEWSELC